MTQTAPSSEAFNQALDILEGYACFQGRKHRLFARCTTFGHENIYYDLTNEEGQAVLISKDGWDVVDVPPILFKRYPHQRAQVRPSRRGNVEKLLDFVNIKADSQKLLLLVYVVAALVPDIPRPILYPYGEHGSTKTTLLRLLKELLDPSAIPMLSLSGVEGEVIQNLSHHYFAPFDNVSSLPTRVSDCLCRAVTGAGHSKRELYSDDEDVIYAFKRLVALNGINIAASRPDLLDRCILFELRRIPQSDRMAEARLVAAFRDAKPHILGGIFDALSTAMAVYDLEEPPCLYRLADFTHWGCAIAGALGYESADFLAAYHQNLTSQNDEALAGSPVASATVQFLEARNEWSGSPSELLRALENEADQLGINLRAKRWPKEAHVLTRRLNEVKSNLAEVGIYFEAVKDGAGFRGRRLFLYKDTENSVASVASTETPARPSDDTSDGKKDMASQVPSHETTLFTSTNTSSDGSDGISRTSGEEDLDSCIDPKTGKEIPIPKEFSAEKQ